MYAPPNERAIPTETCFMSTLPEGLVCGAPHGAISTGPTWMKWADSGEWYLPKLTLGWSVLAWSSQVLLQPDGEQSGEPWQFTNEQARWLLHWYAVDEYGRFVWRRATLRRLKGGGKDPLAASISLIEMMGPCRFGGFGRDGEPIAVPHPAPWIQIAAVNQDQTRTTMSLFPGFLGSKQRALSLGVDLGKTIIYGPGSARIEAVTSSPRALEGSRPSLVISNETHHHLKSNEGRAMDLAIKRNLAKSRGGTARLLSLTNAHEPGEDSVAELDYDAHLQIESGKSRATGFMYDSLEADPETSLRDVDSLRRGLMGARGDADWLDVERLIEEIMDPTTPPSMSMRYYLNQVIAANDAYLSPSEWGACKVDDELQPGDTIGMFFDGSLNDDHSGLVACRIDDGLLQPLGHWDPRDEPNGEIDRDKVNLRVADAFELYDVVAFYADVRMWEAYVDRWRDEYEGQLLVPASPTAHGKKSHAVAWDMRGKVREFSDAVAKFEALARAKDIKQNGDVGLAQHMANAKRAMNKYGYSIRKESRDSGRKIDLSVCAIGASLVRWEVRATGALDKRRSTGGHVFAF